MLALIACAAALRLSGWRGLPGTNVSCKDGEPTGGLSAVLAIADASQLCRASVLDFPAWASAARTSPGFRSEMALPCDQVSREAMVEDVTPAGANSFRAGLAVDDHIAYAVHLRNALSGAPERSALERVRAHIQLVCMVMVMMAHSYVHRIWVAPPTAPSASAAVVFTIFQQLGYAANSGFIILLGAGLQRACLPG